jgi:hypothetical protein
MELDGMKNSYCIFAAVLATVIPMQGMRAQGTKDPSSPPRPSVVQQEPLPSNATPPTPNRVQRNIFSPDAVTPRARRIYRGQGTRP